MSTAAADTTNLAAEDIRFIKEHLGEWLAEQSLGKPPAVYEIELRERMVRVEEELRHQRELIKTILEQMDKRFEALQKELDRRFEAVDKRFEAVDKRFEILQNEMNRRFEALTRRIDRFMIWSYAITLTVGGLVVTILKL
ncbi:hypothetical protein [Candidatus Thiosymbion oneisti]|uniref:hypothetical protein n=1 Tax=Candidatus Thiosymbion oneisti TaxID=589554 RepID=UPI0013FD9DEA|nr:hypothetical protein [Candidatus Thiosymbion oneisti]